MKKDDNISRDKTFENERKENASILSLLDLYLIRF